MLAQIKSTITLSSLSWASLSILAQEINFFLTFKVKWIAKRNTPFRQWILLLHAHSFTEMKSRVFSVWTQQEKKKTKTRKKCKCLWIAINSHEFIYYIFQGKTIFNIFFSYKEIERERKQKLRIFEFCYLNRCFQFFMYGIYVIYVFIFLFAFILLIPTLLVLSKFIMVTYK